MTITEKQLDQVVKSWNEYAAQRPRKIETEDLLVKRDLNMYRAMGVPTGVELARRLVQDRSTASMEMTMGHLFERVLERLGPKKLNNAEKKQPGKKGIDFIEEKSECTRFVNLKAGLATSNADISTAIIRNLRNARSVWESNTTTDDNPLGSQPQQVVLIRAIARGKPNKSTREHGILYLVGDDMWEYFGAGPSLLRRLGNALARRPLDYDQYNEEIKKAERRVFDYLSINRYFGADDKVMWDRLVTDFP